MPTLPDEDDDTGFPLGQDTQRPEGSDLDEGLEDESQPSTPGGARGRFPTIASTLLRRLTPALHCSAIVPRHCGTDGARQLVLCTKLVTECSKHRLIRGRGDVGEEGWYVMIQHRGQEFGDYVLPVISDVQYTALRAREAAAAAINLEDADEFTDDSSVTTGGDDSYAAAAGDTAPTPDRRSGGEGRQSDAAATPQTSNTGPPPPVPPPPVGDAAPPPSSGNEEAPASGGGVRFGPAPPTYWYGLELKRRRAITQSESKLAELIHL